MNSFRLIIFLAIIFGFLVLYQQLTKGAKTTPVSPNQAQQVVTEPTLSPTASSISDRHFAISRAPGDDDDDDEERGGNEDQLRGFDYPKATVISTSESEEKVTTSDNLSTVTAWYKEKLESPGFLTNEFIPAPVKNTFLGSAQGRDFVVVVERAPTDTKTTVTISLKGNIHRKDD